MGETYGGGLRASESSQIARANRDLRRIVWGWRALTNDFDSEALNAHEGYLIRVFAGKLQGNFVEEQRGSHQETNIDVRASYESLHLALAVALTGHRTTALTAAWIEANSTGMRRMNGASGGGFVHSLATASSSWDGDEQKDKNRQKL